jgi:hypothetical protein
MVEPTIRPGAYGAFVCTPEDADGSGLEFRARVLDQQWADHISGTFPLSPEQSLQLRDARERIARILHPNAQFLSSGYSQAEQVLLAARKEGQLRQGNTVAMAFAGPILSVLPGTGRLLGAPERAVEALGSMNLDIVGAAGFMSRIARPRLWRSPIAEATPRVAPKLGVGQLFQAYTESNKGILAELAQDRFLDLVIKSEPRRTPRGGRMFAAALAAFGGRDNIVGIRGTWLGSGELRDNFDSFQKALTAGASPEAAALQTFTGKMAMRNGLIKVAVITNTPSKVVVEFTKP